MDKWYLRHAEAQYLLGVTSKSCIWRRGGITDMRPWYGLWRIMRLSRRLRLWWCFVAWDEEFVGRVRRIAYQFTSLHSAMGLWAVETKLEENLELMYIPNFEVRKTTYVQEISIKSTWRICMSVTEAYKRYLNTFSSKGFDFRPNSDIWYPLLWTSSEAGTRQTTSWWCVSLKRLHFCVAFTRVRSNLIVRHQTKQKCMLL